MTIKFTIMGHRFSIDLKKEKMYSQEEVDRLVSEERKYAESTFRWIRTLVEEMYPDNVYSATTYHKKRVLDAIDGYLGEE